MTDQQVSDADEVFFEALAGRAQGVPGADAVRTALREEAATVQEASSGGSAEPTPQQAALRERIKAKLIAEGAFNGQLASTGREAFADRPMLAKTTSRPRQAEDGAIARFFSWLSSFTGPQMAGLAASMMLGVLVVMNMSANDQANQEDVTRGAASLSVSVADPARDGAQLVERINALGGEAMLVQLNDKEWALSVAIQKPDSIKPVQALLQKSGFQVEGLPPYDLILRKAE
jgi:hypothetical protein